MSNLTSQAASFHPSPVSCLCWALINFTTTVALDSWRSWVLVCYPDVEDTDWHVWRTIPLLSKHFRQLMKRQIKLCYPEGEAFSTANLQLKGWRKKCFSCWCCLAESAPVLGCLAATLCWDLHQPCIVGQKLIALRNVARIFVCVFVWGFCFILSR